MDLIITEDLYFSTYNPKYVKTKPLERSKNKKDKNLIEELEPFFDSIGYKDMMKA
jgi:hypothetical protein